MITFNKWINLREQGIAPAVPGAAAPGATTPGVPNQAAQAGQGVGVQAMPNPKDSPSWTSPQFYVEFHRQKPLADQIALFKQELDKYLQAVHKKKTIDLGQIGTIGGKVSVTPKGKMGEEVNPFVWAEIERAGNILAGPNPAT